MKRLINNLDPLVSRDFFHFDPNMYIKVKGEEIIIVVAHVDYVIITCNNTELINKEKYNICKAFDMMDLGLLHHCLGIVESPQQVMPLILVVE
jgi:hypothetical protein